MIQRYHLTKEGLRKLEEELAELKGQGRESLAKRLKEAIEQGDLSENADYIAAKEEQGFLEGRIQEVETILKNYVLIKNNSNNGCVEIGSTITIQEKNGELETYFLVGPAEADPINGKISFESPIGKAILNKKVGDIVKAKTPGGEISLTIKKIK